MKKFDMSKHIGNIDADLIADALSYKPRGNARIRFIALAACIAIIATSVPLGVILNKKSSDTAKEPPQTTTEDGDDGDDGLQFTRVKFEDIELDEGTVIFGNSFLMSNGYICSEPSETYPFSHSYITPTKEELQQIVNDTVKKAEIFHGDTSVKKPENYKYVGNTAYTANVYDQYLRIKAYQFFNSYVFNQNMSSDLGSSKLFKHKYVIYCSKDTTDEEFIYQIKDVLEGYGSYLGKNFDSYRFLYVGEGEERKRAEVFFWDSKDTEIDQTIRSIKEDNLENMYGDDYNALASRALRFEIHSNFDNEESIILNGHFNTDVYPPINGDMPIENKDYASLDINGYYQSTGSDDALYNCILPLEGYMNDVFGVSIANKPYNIKDVEIHNVINTVVKELTVDLSSQNIPMSEYVVFTFSTLDNETYFLTDIELIKNLANGKYLELLSEKNALSWFSKGLSIGDFISGTYGCFACRAKRGIENENVIPKNYKCELVYIKNVIYESKDGFVSYELPFYAITTESDIKGQYRVSFVPAIDIPGMYEYLSELSRANCCYYKHQKPVN